MASVAIRDVYSGSRFFSVPDPESKGNKKEEGGKNFLVVLPFNQIKFNFTKLEKI
jgi:hypothetical protein